MEKDYLLKEFRKHLITTENQARHKLHQYRDSNDEHPEVTLKNYAKKLESLNQKTLTDIIPTLKSPLKEKWTKYINDYNHVVYQEQRIEHYEELLLNCCANSYWIEAINEQGLHRFLNILKEENDKLFEELDTLVNLLPHEVEDIRYDEEVLFVNRLFYNYFTDANVLEKDYQKLEKKYSS